MSRTATSRRDGRRESPCALRSWTEVAREYRKRTGTPISRSKAFAVCKEAELKIAAALEQLATAPTG